MLDSWSFFPLLYPISSRNFQSPTKAHFHCLIILILKVSNVSFGKMSHSVFDTQKWLMLTLPPPSSPGSSPALPPLTGFCWVCALLSPPASFGVRGFSQHNQVSSYIWLLLSFFSFYLNNFLG